MISFLNQLYPKELKFVNLFWVIYSCQPWFGWNGVEN
jgi:hypothetical protein